MAVFTNVSEKQLKDFLKNYQWSSYQDYCDLKRVQGKILSIKDFPEYFGNKKVFEEEIFDWLTSYSPMSDIGELGD